MTRDEDEQLRAEENEYERKMDQAWHNENTWKLHDETEICPQCHGDDASCDYCDGEGQVAL